MDPDHSVPPVRSMNLLSHMIGKYICRISTRFHRGMAQAQTQEISVCKQTDELLHQLPRGKPVGSPGEALRSVEICCADNAFQAQFSFCRS